MDHNELLKSTTESCMNTNLDISQSKQIKINIV